MRRGEGMRRLAAAFALAGAVALPMAAPPPASAAGRCGEHPWCDTTLSAAQRTQLLLAALTFDEKVGLMAGDDGQGVATGNPATGTSDGVPRLDVPTVYYSDGPVGPREGNVTAMPAPIGLAATFDPRFARRTGVAIADEVRKKGNDVVHAPTVDIMRTPLAGRTFEGYGEDPFLSSRMGVEWIEGAQSQGVVGNIKHFAPNSQEGAPPGVPPLTPVVGSRFTVDSIVDERTLREIYLQPFEAAVKEAGVGSVMCAYNRLNGSPACESRDLLERILRRDWGFDGYVLSDYGFATKSTANSANNGLELDMPVGFFYSRGALTSAVATGQVSQATIDLRVGNILRTMFRFGLFDREAFPSDESQIDKPAHARVARETLEQGITLLRNTGTLPLSSRRLRSLAIIGDEAERLKNGGGSSAVRPYAFNTPREAITKRAGPGVQVRYDPGEDNQRAAAAAKGADVAIVFASDTATEGVDKANLSTDDDDLVDAVAAANPNTVVVLETAGPVLTPWREKVDAVLEAWYPGQEAGPAIARVLFGDTDPGGRLPATFPRRESDAPAMGDASQYPGVVEVQHKEGVFVGYRHYDERGIAPAYPFGHGLSYSRFAYRDLRVERGKRGRATVSAVVRNTGRRRGTEVAQLYLGLPDPKAGVSQPPRALKGMRKVTLKRGASRRVRFALDRRALSYWDVSAGGWRVAPGCYGVMVGRSSRDIRLRGGLTVGGARCPRTAARGCLSPRAPVGQRNIGRIRAGLTRRALARRVRPVKRGPRVQRWCVKRSSRRVSAAFGGRSVRSRALVVVTRAPRHGNRGVRPGSSRRALRRAFPGARPIAPGVLRAGRRNAVLFGVRRGRVRYVAVAQRRLLERPRALRRALRRAAGG